MNITRTGLKLSTRHFIGLDGLRGIAALAVVTYHVCLPLHINVATKAYLAVDLFFLLSGFVVANAYEQRLLTKLAFLEFAVIRLARLYPLFLLGMAMGIVVSALKVFMVLHAVNAPQFLLAAIMGMMLIPFGHLPYSEASYLFPFNGPAWSLFFELVINFVYAGAVTRWLPRKAFMLLMLSAIGLLGAVWLHGSVDLGGQPNSFVGGLLRTSFSFFAGVAIYRGFLKVGAVQIRYSGLVASVILTAGLLMGSGINRVLYDCAAVFVVIPAVVVLAVCSNPVGIARTIAVKAGALSYPLYITHYPVMRVFQFVAERHHLGGIHLYAFVTVELVVVLSVAQAALRLYDAPLQAMLKNRNGTGHSRLHSLVAPSAGR